jgi:hypothetical protein
MDYDPDDATDRAYYDAAGRKHFTMEIIEAFGLNFALGCVVKYVLRAGRKTQDGTLDLEKAHWYLGREIERRKAASK